MSSAPIGTIHHVELWVPDIDRAAAQWGWLLTELGYQPFQEWTGGCSWRLADTYIVIEQSPDMLAEPHDRKRPGLNHLAFHAGDQAQVDALTAAAAENGWALMFADKHPHAGGPQTYAAYLSNTDGHEVELTASNPVELTHPQVLTIPREGATDMILLPTLMRAAIGQDSLPYQVAPGLSEMPKDSYPELDFQAARVAFLVDGDGGGQRLAETIGRAIPDDRVVTLDVHGIENTLDSDFYLGTFTALLRDVNAGVTIGELPSLPDATAAPWSTTLEAWAASQGWRAPTKQEIANHLIELDEVTLSPQGVVALKQAHAALLTALGITS